MTIDGIYYTEPELAAKVRQMQETIDRYEAENRKLTEEKEELGGLYNDASLVIGYLEQRCEELETREKEYKRLLEAAVKDLENEKQCRNCEYQGTGLGTICLGCRGEKWEWRCIGEAEKLIGGEDG